MAYHTIVGPCLITCMAIVGAEWVNNNDYSQHLHSLLIVTTSSQSLCNAHLQHLKSAYVS